MVKRFNKKAFKNPFGENLLNLPFYCTVQSDFVKMHQHLQGQFSSSRGKSEVGSTPKWWGQRFQQSLKRLPSFLRVKSQKIKPVHNPSHGSKSLNPSHGSKILNSSHGSKILTPSSGSKILTPSHGSKILPPSSGSKTIIQMIICLTNKYINLNPSLGSKTPSSLGSKTSSLETHTKPPKNISKGRYNSHRNPFIINEIHVATNEVHSKYMSQKGNEDNSQRRNEKNSPIYIPRKEITISRLRVVLITIGAKIKKLNNKVYIRPNYYPIDFQISNMSDTTKKIIINAENENQMESDDVDTYTSINEEDISSFSTYQKKIVLSVPKAVKIGVKLLIFSQEVEKTFPSVLISTHEDNVGKITEIILKVPNDIEADFTNRKFYKDFIAEFKIVQKDFQEVKYGPLPVAMNAIDFKKLLMVEIIKVQKETTIKNFKDKKDSLEAAKNARIKKAQLQGPTVEDKDEVKATKKKKVETEEELANEESRKDLEEYLDNTAKQYETFEANIMETFEKVGVTKYSKTDYSVMIVTNLMPTQFPHFMIVKGFIATIIKERSYPLTKKTVQVRIPPGISLTPQIQHMANAELIRAGNVTLNWQEATMIPHYEFNRIEKILVEKRKKNFIFLEAPSEEEKEYLKGKSIVIKAADKTILEFSFDIYKRSKKTKQGNQPSLKNFAGVKSKKKKL